MKAAILAGCAGSVTKPSSRAILHSVSTRPPKSYVSCSQLVFRVCSKDWTALTIRSATAQRDLRLKSLRPGTASTYWDLWQQKRHDIVFIYGAEGSRRIEWWTDAILVAHIDVSYLEYDGVWSGADPRRFEDYGTQSSLMTPTIVSIVGGFFLKRFSRQPRTSPAYI